METVSALIFTIFLVVPLALQLQALIIDPEMWCKIFDYCSFLYGRENKKEEKAPEILQYYPKESISFSATSDSRVIVAQLRPVFSSPALSRETTIKGASQNVEALLPPTTHSSSFVKTERILPVVDISWNYDWYRFKAFEASLRNRYGINYPPGEVVLNCMQLNLPDSKTKVQRNVSRGLFDFVKESDIALHGPLSRTLEIEYLNPLDHFVLKPCGKALTEEKWTETLREREHDEESTLMYTLTPITSVNLDKGKQHCNLQENRRLNKTHDLPHLTVQQKFNSVNGNRLEHKLMHVRNKRLIN